MLPGNSSNPTPPTPLCCLTLYTGCLCSKPSFLLFGRPLNPRPSSPGTEPLLRLLNLRTQSDLLSVLGLQRFLAPPPGVFQHRRPRAEEVIRGVCICLAPGRAGPNSGWSFLAKKALSEIGSLGDFEFQHRNSITVLETKTGDSGRHGATPRAFNI